MIIGGQRNCGKTYELILISNKKNKPICVVDRHRIKFVKDMAKEMNVEIPNPVTFDYLKKYGNRLDSLLIDDLETVLQIHYGISIDVASISQPLRSMYINKTF